MTDYSDYVTRLAGYAVVPESNADFVVALPTFIAYAENRIYNDLDLLSTVVADSSGTLSANTRNFTLPVPAAGAYDIVDQINILESGIRTPLQPVSRSVVDTLWGTTNAAAVSTRPSMFAMTDNDVITVGPPSGASVTLEVLGRVKPTPLSASNTSTYLTQQYPALFLAASMIQVSGWQKNFAAAGSDDPGSGMNWSQQYLSLLKGADQTSAREDFAGASWTSRRVEPFAQPQRG